MRAPAGVGAAWATVLLLGAGAGPATAQGAPATDPGPPEAPGRLLSGTLVARILPGGDAEVSVSLLLAGVAGREGLPLTALSFGGAPEGVRGGVDGGAPAPVVLQEVRPGALEGRIGLPAGAADTARVRLEYRVAGAFRRGPDDPPASALVALPWVVVPWPPDDGAPGRVEVELDFPGPVRIREGFPSGFAAGPFRSGQDGVDAAGLFPRWTARLPVLPSLTRVRAQGPGASSASLVTWRDGGITGPGNPPSAPWPGFVFTGLFAAFGLVTVGYAVWMVRTDDRRPTVLGPHRAGRRRRR